MVQHQPPRAAERGRGTPKTVIMAGLAAGVAGIGIFVAVVRDRSNVENHASFLLGSSGPSATAFDAGALANPTGSALDRKLERARAERDKVTGEMVRIPAGTYKMGSNDGDADERPVRGVRVEAYAMDKTEVTVAAYTACVEAGKCQASSTVEWPGLTEADVVLYSRACNWGKTDRNRHPMNCVDWVQAKAFCEWAEKRLPTEEEWEYAARGTDGRTYPWGDNLPEPTLLNACGPECVQWAEETWRVTWKPMYSGDDGWPTTAPVGQYPFGASPFGVLDMAGNVWEWTASGYSGDYGENRARDRFVDRGGGWGSDQRSTVRAADRAAGEASFRNFHLGLRCAR